MYIALTLSAVVGLILIAAFAWRRVVPTNEIHVLQSRKKMTAYGRAQENGNVYYSIPSFIPYFGVSVTQLPIDIFKIPLDGYEAYDVAKVPFSVDAIAFFQIEDAVTASQRIGDYEVLKAQLADTLRGAVRKVLAGHPIEKIMGIRNELGEEFFKEVSDDVKNWGVKVNSIEFMDITDAPGTKVVTNIMDKERTTIEKESRLKVADNTKQAEIAETEAAEATELRELQKNQAVALRNEEVKQKTQEAAAITKTKEMAVLEIDTVRQQEITREQAKVEADANRQVAIIAAEAEKQVAITKADAQALAAKRSAEGYKDAKVLEGEGESKKTQSVGTAEADIIKAKGLAAAEAKSKEADALQKFNDAATRIEQLKAAVEIQKAKWAAFAEALSNADLKLVTSGQGANILGTFLNAETGADAQVALEQLGIDIPAILSRFTKSKDVKDTPPAKK